MRNVEIYFNPYSESTRLVVDSEERTDGDSRLEDFIVGRPLENWLSPYVFSYQKWNGLLPELMEYLNDDEIKLTFFTPPQYVQLLAEAFDRQKTLIEENGYSSGLWSCRYEDAFLPENVRAAFLQFTTCKRKFAPDQWSINLFDSIEAALDEESHSVETLRAIYLRLHETVQNSKRVCLNSHHSRDAIQFWETAELELTNIFD